MAWPVRALALGLLTSAGPAAAGELSVVSEPAGATVAVNGAVQGVTPTTLTLSDEPGRTLTVSLPGYQTFEIALPVEAAGTIAVPLSTAGGRIPVTVGDDRPPDWMDGEITLREAILYASGARPVQGRDRLRVDGTPGAGSADMIEPAGGAGDNAISAVTIAGHRSDESAPLVGLPGETLRLSVVSDLPPLSDPGDAIRFPVSRWTRTPTAVLLPDPAGDASVGLRVAGGTDVQGLALSGFSTGIAAAGPGTVTLADVFVSGTTIAVRATGGAEVAADNVRTDAEALSAAVDATSIISGVEWRPPLDGQAPEPGRGVVLAPERAEAPLRGIELVGRFAHADAIATLYAREPEPKSLHAVEGIGFDASSYAAYRAWGVEAYQEWPSYAADGTPTAFRWEFSYRQPGDGAGEWLRISLQRPIRTGSLRILHNGNDTSTLRRYRLLIHGFGDAVVLDREIAGEPAGDVGAVDPASDIWSITIEVLDTDGGYPGIVEIEASVFDSVAIPAMGQAPDRIVFDGIVAGPDGACRAAAGNTAGSPCASDAFAGGGYRIGNSFYALEADAFRAGASFTLDETGYAPILDEEAVAIDIADETALVAALERAEPLVLRLPGRALTLSEPIAPAGTALTLIGQSGTELRRADGATDRPVVDWSSGALEDGTGGRLSLSGLAVAGTIRARGLNHLALRDVQVIADGAGTAVEAEAWSTLVARCQISGADVGVAVRGVATVVDSEIAAGDVALRTELRGGVVALGNVLTAGRAAWELVETPYTRFARLLAVGNELGVQAALLVPREPEAAPPAIAGLVADNVPASLGLPPDAITIDFDPRSFGHFVDLRAGSGATRIDFVDLSARDGRMVIDDGGTLQWRFADYLTVLHEGGGDLFHVAGGLAWHRGLGRTPGGGLAVSVAAPQAALPLSTPDDQPVVAAGLEVPTLLRPGLALPDRFAADAARAAVDAVYSLAEAGDHRAALMTGVMAAERASQVGPLAEALAYAAQQYALAEEAAGRWADARLLLQELAGRFPDVAPLKAVMVGHLNRDGVRLLDLEAWEDAALAYAAIVAIDPTDEVATNNGFVALRNGTLAAAADGAGAAEAWVARMQELVPALIPDAAALMALARGGAIEALIEAGDWPAAFAAARDAHADVASDDTASTLLFVTQEWFGTILQTVGGDGDAAGALLAAWQATLDTDRSLEADFVNVLLYSINTAWQERADAVGSAAMRRFVEAFVAGLEASSNAASAAAARDVALLAVQNLAPSVEAAAAAGDLAGVLDQGLPLLALSPAPETENLVAWAVRTALEAMGAVDAEVAVAALERALAEHPNTAPLRLGGSSFLKNTAVARFEAGDLPGVRDILRRGVALFPDDETMRSNLHVAYFNHSIELIDAGLHREAVDWLDEALQLFPGDADLENNRAYALQVLEQ